MDQVVSMAVIVLMGLRMGVVRWCQSACAGCVVVGDEQGGGCVGCGVGSGISAGVSVVGEDDGEGGGGGSGKGGVMVVVMLTRSLEDGACSLVSKMLVSLVLLLRVGGDGDGVSSGFDCGFNGVVSECDDEQVGRGRVDEGDGSAVVSFGL